MSTFITISAHEKDKRYIEDGFKIIRNVEMSLSSYNPKAKIFLLNKNLQVELDEYTYEALKLAQKYYKQSDGYFDVTIGSITKDLYKFGENEQVVTKKELQSAKVDFLALSFDKKKAYIKNGIKIDLGGMGKGFAVDRVVEYFLERDVKDATIAASGDIRCLMVCSIDIQNPFNDNALISFESSKENLGITTSGNYNRYIKSVKNNHLINPKLKKSQDNFIFITLIGDISSSDLDAYATAVSVMPKDKAYEFLERIGVAYIVLQSDKELVISKNISKFTNNLIISDAVKKQPRYIYYKKQK
ncbi:MAG: FAD:protein FMN transferase [Sulfurimonas sp.]|nr:FAD:protein FMN transferase [Sulfurimonas sp.]